MFIIYHVGYGIAQNGFDGFKRCLNQTVRNGFDGFELFLKLCQIRNGFRRFLTVPDYSAFGPRKSMKRSRRFCAIVL